MLGVLCLQLLALSPPLPGQPPSPQHGRRPAVLVITDAMLIEGNATPAEGPVDIVIQHNRIARITRSRPDAGYRHTAEAVIQAAGQYVLPGFINMHGHLQDERAGLPMPFDYQYKLWLGCGITTVRDVGSDYDKALAEKRKSAANTIAAPRLWLYFWCPGGDSEAEIRAKVRELKAKGAEGLKCHQMDRATYLIVAEEAKKLGLKLAHHAGVEDLNAWHDAQAGTSTIEHWYGVPEAALTGVQQFPPDFNYNNELHRFRYAGRLWREVDPAKLRQVLQALVQAGVAWDPTLCIYEACRDLQRALTQPWFKDYLHPALAAFFQPNPDFHGSFFHGWTSTDEVYWKENYRLWMQAIREFSRLGGVVTTGEDAGFIYQIY
ncbi:MAG: amidohydrolase family protein, partial [candidate division KSB1 bacterium]|nr:amidohydrolase family protein [candidate division KSB1 bacterium]